MAGLYDLMLLLDADAPDDRREQAVGEVERMIASDGELIQATEWGRRRLAYEIDHRPEADYRLFQFRADNALLERLRHTLKIADGVLRFRIIKLKPGAPTPPPPGDQAPRQREGHEGEAGRVAARAAADAPPT